MLVLSFAISQGRRVALARVAGVALGDLLAMSASLAGLGALVLTSATLFKAFKWVGAAYLIYLGTKLFHGVSSASLANVEELTQAFTANVFGYAPADTALMGRSRRSTLPDNRFIYVIYPCYIQHTIKFLHLKEFP